MQGSQGVAIQLGRTRGQDGCASRYVKDSLSWSPSLPFLWCSASRWMSPSFLASVPLAAEHPPDCHPDCDLRNRWPDRGGIVWRDQTGLAWTLLKLPCGILSSGIFGRSSHGWIRRNWGGALLHGTGCWPLRRWRIHAGVRGTCPCMLGRRLRLQPRFTYRSRSVPDSEVSPFSRVGCITWASLVCHVSCTR